jgi:hypothetical protein
MTIDPMTIRLVRSNRGPRTDADPSGGDRTVAFDPMPIGPMTIRPVARPVSP